MDGGFHWDLSIAGLAIRLETQGQLLVSEAFEPFLTETKRPDYTVTFRQVPHLGPIPEAAVHRDNCYRIHPDGRGGFLRSFFDAPRDLAPYGRAEWTGERHLTVEYLKKGEKCLSEMASCFFHAGPEALMIRENRVYFHAACVDTPLGGILFSGPSGIGKSTQARLWQIHRGGRLINGDRPILERRADGFYAWGSPYAGSSRCYVNDCCGVSAVVLLGQAPRCSIRRLGPAEAFRRIYSGLTISLWDRQFAAAACDMAVELTQRVPVYELLCTPDKAAVDCLEAKLREDLVQ